MKKMLTSATAFLVISAALVSSEAQEQPARSSAAQPHKIGLIDMARVFKEYKKFEDRRNQLKAEYDSLQAGGQDLATQIKALNEEMQAFSQGSAEYAEREQKLIKLNAQLQAYGQGAQRDLIRKESQIFRDVYTETLDVVRLYCEQFGFTLVLRFDSGGFDSDDPKEVLETLNQQVVYHRNTEDITTAIIKYMNGQYGTQTGSQARSTGATRTK